MNQESKTDLDFKEAASYKTAINTLYNIKANETLKERISYTEDTLPFSVQTDIYKYLIDNTINFHWHHDFEYNILLEGNVNYYINDTHIRLEKGDVLFINSNILHMSRKAENSEDAVMYTLTLSTNLLSANINSSIYMKYVQPLLNTQIEGFKILKENAIGGDIKSLLMKIYLLEPSAYGYELECLEYIIKLWHKTLNYMDNNRNSLLYSTGNIRHSQRMKEILSYIHKHFNEKIIVNDIADHIHISRGECFRCFKHYMDKTPVEYINEYRLQQSAKLLRETENSIVDICTVCGFENTSYFSKIFKDTYSMTPFQYRKAQIWTNKNILNINNYDYEYWKDSGNGTMIITANANNGSFSCEWHNINNISFRSGKKFKNFDRTHKQLGDIFIKFHASYNSIGSSYLCVYGWTVDPLIEWYIIECYNAYKPSLNLNCLGSFYTDDGTYEIYRTERKNRPTVLDSCSDFGQYWSIRTIGRFSGTVNVSAHFHNWENMGLALGKLTEISLSVEGWKSSGTAFVSTNILTISGGLNI